MYRFRFRNHTAEVVFDGAATQGLASLLEPGHKYGELVTKALQTGVLRGACAYCAKAFQVKDMLDKAGIPVIDSRTHHPDIGQYVDEGYEVLTLVRFGMTAISSPTPTPATSQLAPNMLVPLSTVVPVPCRAFLSTGVHSPRSDLPHIVT